jgi:broad specificity phosphatase PhoE
LNQIWLVRHGETEWTKSKRHTSRTDIALTPEGEEAARALAPVLARHSFAVVFTSPRRRARRTAELAGFPDAQVDEELVELDYGEYEGRTSAEIREARPDWFLWRDGAAGGESIEEVGERADRVRARIEGADGDVLLFGHGHFSRILGARLVGLEAADGRLLILDPGAISVIGSEHERRAVRVWNWSPECVPPD